MSTLAPTGPRPHANRLRPLVWGGSACLLLLPALAMWRGVEGVHWTVGDFVVMGTLLAAACALYELGTRLSGSTAYRAGFALAVGSGLATVWVNLAVGMFGGEANPWNLVFGGVLLVAAVGALVARFRARGMGLAMLATAVAQLGAALGLWVVLASGGAPDAGLPPAREALLVALFALPWLGAAALFAHAARRDGMRAGR
jgi:hypothetical protein